MEITGFPAPSKHATANVNGKIIDIVTIGFNDKITVMISSLGKMGKMYYVPLLASPVAHMSELSSLSDDDSFDMLPLPYLTPMPLVGGESDDYYGRIYSAQIASLITRQAPEDRRIVVVGIAVDIGPRPGQDVLPEHRQEFLEIIKQVQICKVW